MKINVFFLFWVLTMVAQTPPDSLYREDQFYLGINYIALKNKPTGVKQHAISASINGGLLRDIPFTPNRHWAIAPGVGYNYQNIKYNLKVYDAQTYSVTAESYDKNKLVLHALELPVEIRWRNSTPQSHIFWRIYAGYKLSYIFTSKSEYQSATQHIRIINNPNINPWQHTVYLTAGQNTWNGYVSYTLSPLFSNVGLSGNLIEIQGLQFGLMFYIL